MLELTFNQHLNRVIEEEVLIRAILRPVILAKDGALSHAGHDQLLDVEQVSILVTQLLDDRAFQSCQLD